jgi:DNA-directed RNA polymerase specialized sigma24 family protein
MQELAEPEQEAPVRLTQQEAQEMVLQTVATHAESLLRTAYRHSFCADDAHDAYQRGMEIFMRRARTLDPQHVDRWLHVVVKREAAAVRRDRAQQVASEDIDFDRHEASHVASPEERMLTADRTTRAAEALRRLKPQELRAIWLKALGHSYADAAGNEKPISRPQPLRTDNQAPAAPVALASPSATSQANSFSASWSLPADSGTPIVAARFRLCQNGTCGAVQNAPSLTGVSGLALPAAGAAMLRVWLVDQLGHENAAGASTLTLSYAPPAPQHDATPVPTPMPDPTPITPPPLPRPPAVTKVSAGLKLTSVRRVGRKVTVAGKLSTRASGRVTVRYRVHQGRRTRTETRHATIRRSAFRLTFTLSATIAKSRSATVSVGYTGDADTRSATARSTLRLRAR